MFHRFIFLISLAVIVLSGCSLSGSDIHDNPDSSTNFRISFTAPEARTIIVEEFTIEYLFIEISGSQNETFYWYPDSCETIDLELSIGNYDLSVTHRAKKGDEEIEFTENAAFEIKPNIITRITIIPGAVGILNVDENTPVEQTDLEIIQEKIIGSWVGTVSTPWTESYGVNIEFKADGTYSAQSSSSTYPAFYYGTDDDSELKTYDIYDQYDTGECVGTITVLFDVGTTNVSKLDFISFSEGYNNLTFEYWHRSEYGPVVFELTRE